MCPHVDQSYTWRLFSLAPSFCSWIGHSDADIRVQHVPSPPSPTACSELSRPCWSPTLSSSSFEFSSWRLLLLPSLSNFRARNKSSPTQTTFCFFTATVLKVGFDDEGRPKLAKHRVRTYLVCVFHQKRFMENGLVVQSIPLGWLVRIGGICFWVGDRSWIEDGKLQDLLWQFGFFRSRKWCFFVEVYT